SLRDMEIIQRTNDTCHLAKDLDRVAIPSTIQDVIMARVDSLPAPAKELLQAGSAIEREFSYELIKAVTELPEQELLSHLSVLKDAELLYERGIFPHSTFVFKHALTREVVYDSILAKRQKLLHEKIGRAIEDLYGDNVGDHYGVLLEHFLTSEVHEKAAKYARLASKKAEKTASLNDAILFAEKGIACLERLPPSDEVEKKIIDARTVLGLYLLQMGNLHKAKEAVDPILEAAARRGYTRRLSQIYTVTGTFNYWVKEDFSTALEHLNHGLRLGIQLGDMVSVALASYYLAVALAMDCRFHEASAHLEQSLKINMAANNLWGVANMKSNQSLLQSWHGLIELSHRTGKEAVNLAEQSADIYSKIVAHACHGLSYYYQGHPEEAIHCFLEGLALGEMNTHSTVIAMIHFALAESYLEMGDYEAAQTHARRSFDLLDRMGLLPSWANLARIALEKTRVLSGEKNVELERFRHYVQNNRVKLYQGDIQRYLAEILLIVDDQHLEEAQHWIEEAIEADRRNQVMFHLGRDYAVYAELFGRKGDKEKAKEQLGRAIDIYKECGADGWVTRAEEELAKLS
ncbi:MAG: hypothetical protein HY913_12850, partial [Desulfomonile tiedjei]|nr:hypothetical protein [Desulfomonile tiedjei]